MPRLERGEAVAGNCKRVTAHGVNPPGGRLRTYL